MSGRDYARNENDGPKRRKTIPVELQVVMINGVGECRRGQERRRRFRRGRKVKDGNRLRGAWCTGPGEGLGYCITAINTIKRYDVPRNSGNRWRTVWNEPLQWIITCKMGHVRERVIRLVELLVTHGLRTRDTKLVAREAYETNSSVLNLCKIQESSVRKRYDFICSVQVYISRRLFFLNNLSLWTDKKKTQMLGGT